jgi:hypothetical protein
MRITDILAKSLSHFRVLRDTCPSLGNALNARQTTLKRLFTQPDNHNDHWALPCIFPSITLHRTLHTPGREGEEKGKFS